MSKILIGVFGCIAGYLVGAGAGAALVAMLSANVHDKSLETVMTAIFVTGPAGAVIGAIAALVWSTRRASKTP